MSEVVCGTLANAERALLDALDGQDHWKGRLSSSALATAVAVCALRMVHKDQAGLSELLAAGEDWLRAHVNPDGGWGDTPDSPSNLSTTLLCWAVLRSGPRTRMGVARREAERWLAERAGSLDASALAAAVNKTYGADRTFSAPILAMSALSGAMGSGQDAWRPVPALPFEAALLPRAIFRWAGLPVVSYALPALIAVGVARFKLGPAPGALAGLVRRAAEGPALSRLSVFQPSHGGFLEAVPLTGFVVMCLVAAGHRETAVVRKGVEFLKASIRPDGSWPVDSNLATWVTTLAVKALTNVETIHGSTLPADCREGLRQWLLAGQTKSRHPFTGGPPGGWAWTDLPGGVPDADDTAGALLALRCLDATPGASAEAACRGIDWLLRIQNRDGGFPTFCRGWGHLPFDRSCPDITAHVMCALDAWYDALPSGCRPAVDAAIQAAVAYIENSQAAAGCWVPLWFGNQGERDGRNPVYGTSLVVRCLADMAPGRLPNRDVLVQRGRAWLIGAQNDDGGWGGGTSASSIEETALALSALMFESGGTAVRRGVAWLCAATERGRCFQAKPIGLYFASLWYAEALYPLLFTVDALKRLAQSAGDGCSPLRSHRSADP